MGSIYPNTRPEKPHYLKSLIDGESEQTQKYPIYTECDCTSYNRSLLTMSMDMSKNMNMKDMDKLMPYKNLLKTLPFCSDDQDKNNPNKIDECNKCGFYFLGMPWTNINFRKYSMHEPLLYVLPDSIYEFKASAKGPHPMHNHVNPIQLMENVGNGGFVAMKGDWRDTLGFSGTFTFRVITLDFIGRNIMHCHTLTHEDTGMMAFYQIVNITNNQNVYNNQSEWKRLCKNDKWKIKEIEEKKQEHKVVKWCKNNKIHCAGAVGTGIAIAFL